MVGDHDCSISEVVSLMIDSVYRDDLGLIVISYQTTRNASSEPSVS